MKTAGFATIAVHEAGPKKDAHRALRFPIYAGAAFDFESAEAMADTFSGRRAAHAYSRISNPTVEALERKMTVLEAGLATVAVSSGMAAIAAALLNLLTAGDNIVAASSLFGGTYSLFRNVFEPLGISTRFVSADDVRAIEGAIDDHTRVVFLETISNPCMIVPDFVAIAEIAHKNNVVLMADSTVTTPYLFNAGQFGLNVVVHSTTKYVSGGATSMGGVIVDLGNFDWTHIPALKNYHRFKEMAFIARLRKEVYRETGSCLSPHNAYLQILGLETLSLRMDRICRNAQAIAEFLEAQRAVRSVLYPGLDSSPFHDLARQQFDGLYGGVLSFNLPDRAGCFSFLNALSIIRRASNLGDNKTLALHPASTIFAGFTEVELKSIGIDDTLIRISVGIEDSVDLIDDIRAALKGIENV
ncbi:MAG: aminotransferase class I/II-fold pyridoxal phosphate-dependent enzyme [Syntrophales bacterium]